MNTAGAGRIAELEAALAAAGQREVQLAAENASLRELLELEAKSNNGNTALICASKHGHTETAQALLAAGADKEAKDNNGSTALILAMHYGHTEIVALLKASIPVCVPVAEAPLHSSPSGGAPQAAAEPACAAGVPPREQAPPDPGRGDDGGGSSSSSSSSSEDDE